MFKVGDFVVYKRDVCKIKEYKKNYFNNKDYYALVPYDDSTLVIDIPVDNQTIRPLIANSDIEKIINSIPQIDIIDCQDRMLENEYRKLLASETYEDLIKIIKTTYVRNKERKDNHKKIGDKDLLYFEKAERYLYNEFSVVLGLTYNETRDYVIDKVTALEG